MSKAPKPVDGKYSRALAVAFELHCRRVPISPAFDAWERRREAFGLRYRDDYLRSDAWTLKRTSVLVRAGGWCEQCGARRPLEVHHLTYLRLTREDPEKDLMALCRDCHQREHDATVRVRVAIKSLLAP